MENQTQETIITENETVNTGVDTTTTDVTATETNIEMLTKDEVDKLLQSETDKVRGKYSNKVKELEAQIEALKPKEEVVEKSETEILAETKLAELEAKEREIEAKQKHLDVVETLSKNNLPSELADMINADSFDVSKLQEILNKATLNNSYQPSNRLGGSKDLISKEEFSKMSPVERSKLLDSNPELYNRLANR